MRLFGSVLVVASAGQVYRIDAQNGETLKLYELTSNLEANLTCLAIHRNMVICNTTHRMVALSRDRLKKMWKSSDLGERFDCAEVVGDMLFVASDGEVHALDLDSGQTVFTERFEGPRKAITFLADETTNPEKPILYVGHCGKVHAIDVIAKTRFETEFVVTEDASFGVSLALYRGLLIASSGGIVMAFQTSTLTEVWLHQFGHETGYGFMTTLQCIRQNGRDLIIVGSNGYVVAVDAKTGEQQWMTSLPRGGYAFVSTLFYDNTLYVTSNGRMWSLNPENGEVIWNMGLTGMGSHSPLLISTTSRNNMSSDTPILQAQHRMPNFSLFR
jgi:outer membrane protein assembly factor BamB